MIVLNKKRIYIIFSCFLALVVFLEIQTAKVNEENIVQTVALPVSNKVIIIDAGHGSPDNRCIK